MEAHLCDKSDLRIHLDLVESNICQKTFFTLLNLPEKFNQSLLGEAVKEGKVNV